MRPVPATAHGLRDACTSDAAPIAAIYNPYVRETVITFETEAVDAVGMSERITAAQAAGLPWLLAQAADGTVAGYAYASPWRPRAAYRHTVECSVYLHTDAHGRGLGRALYTELLARLRAAGLHTALGVIALPNAASVALHESLGFKPVAHLPEVGHKFGRWVDVGYWQCML